MITVYQALNQYCIEKNLPPPTKFDLVMTGRFISHHFKRYWANKEPYDVIPDAGFVKSNEPDGLFVVAAYPDVFYPEMCIRFDDFFTRKSNLEQPLVIKKEPTKKRKRIPVRPIKERSATPKKDQGQKEGQI